MTDLSYGEDSNIYLSLQLNNLSRIKNDFIGDLYYHNNIVSTKGEEIKNTKGRIINIKDFIKAREIPFLRKRIYNVIDKEKIKEYFNMCQDNIYVFLFNPKIKYNSESESEELSINFSLIKKEENDYQLIDNIYTIDLLNNGIITELLEDKFLSKRKSERFLFDDELSEFKIESIKENAINILDDYYPPYVIINIAGIGINIIDIHNGNFLYTNNTHLNTIKDINKLITNKTEKIEDYPLFLSGDNSNIIGPFYAFNFKEESLIKGSLLEKIGLGDKIKEKIGFFDFYKEYDKIKKMIKDIMSDKITIVDTPYDLLFNPEESSLLINNLLDIKDIETYLYISTEELLYLLRGIKLKLKLYEHGGINYGDISIPEEELNVDKDFFRKFLKISEEINLDIFYLIEYNGRFNILGFIRNPKKEFDGVLPRNFIGVLLLDEWVE